MSREKHWRKWVRLDTNFAQNPKFVVLRQRNAYRTIFVYLDGLAYAGDWDTDGYLPRGVLPLLDGRPADAKALVEVGLWEKVDGGWQIHDWEFYQLTRETADAVWQVRHERSTKGNCVRWHGPDCGCWKNGGLRVLPPPPQIGPGGDR